MRSELKQDESRIDQAAPDQPPHAPSERAALTRVPVQVGVAPKSLEEAWRLAQMLAKSDLVPKPFRNRPEDVLVAMQMGLEIGFAPMQALQSIAVINGRPGVWGDGFLALIMASSLYQDHDEYFEVEGQRCDGLVADDLKKDATTAVCTFHRRGKRTPVTRRFTIAQARKAGLLDKKDTPWQTYPDRMLAMKARSWAGRDCFPDLMRGIRTAEELHDSADGDVSDLAPAPAPQQPRRASAARTTTPPQPQPTAPVPSIDTGSDMLGGLLVTHTGFVRPPQGEPFYEIRMQTPTGEERTFVTRAELLYKEAASFEGSDHRVSVQFHVATRAETSQRVFVLDRLSIDEGVSDVPGHARASGELFNG